MEIKELLEKYPFLNYHNVFSGKLTHEKEEDRLKYNWWTTWDAHGWEKIWKKYLSLICKEWEKLSDEVKKEFMILDTKEKYGSLRVNISYGNNAMVEMGDILNMLSQWTCCVCGKMPRNSNGNRIIWESNDWICPYCKDCIKKDMNGDWTLKYTNWKIRDLKLKSKGFVSQRYNKNGEFIYTYKDLGDWLELDKIIQIEDGRNE